MKRFYLLGIAAFYSLLFQGHAFGQGCLPATDQANLDINNVRCSILNGGDLWWVPETTVPVYEVPNGSGKNALYAGALWMGGIDTLGQLHVAAQTYRQSGNDYWPGILDNFGEADAATCGQFDRIWSVLGNDISTFIDNFIAAGGVSLPPSAIPESILQWPGRNNPNFTYFELPIDRDLAPFYDYNHDGYYDPTLGDYPVIASEKPVYADQMTWCVFNDNGNTHGETGGLPLKMEVGLLAYAFANDSIDAINNATFYRYTLRSYNNSLLDDFILGVWSDPDLGNYLDDHVGCMPEKNAGYAYNCINHDSVYGDQPPAIVLHFLDPINDENNNDLSMNSFISYNNNFTATGNPEEADDFYNFLNAHWKDGTPVTLGENGYMGTIPTNFMFSGEMIDSTSSWTECQVNNPCGDRRMLMALQPLSMNSRDVRYFTMGVYYVPQFGGCPDIDPALLGETINTSTAFHNSLGLLNPELTPLGIDDKPNMATPSPVTVRIDPQNKLCYLSTQGGMAHVSVYDIIGNPIVQPFAMQQSTQIDTHTWQTGFYLIVVIDTNGGRHVKKVFIY